MNTNKQLTRSTVDEQIAGVCAGLADYFGIDVVLVRAAFVIATLMGGPGLLLYIVLVFVMPEDKVAVREPRNTVEIPVNQEKAKRV